MLKITTRREAGVLVFQLEGRLAGPWVNELELCWQAVAGTQQKYALRVDLSAVTFIDAEGKALLGQMSKEGAELIASGCLNRCIVEELIQAAEKKEVR